MALSERKPSVVRKGPPCTMGLLLATIKPADRATLLEWLNDARSYPATWIADQLTAEYQQHVGDTTVQRHRKGRCLCSVESL